MSGLMFDIDLKFQPSRTKFISASVKYFWKWPPDWYLEYGPRVGVFIIQVVLMVHWKNYAKFCIRNVKFKKM